MDSSITSFAAILRISAGCSQLPGRKRRVDSVLLRLGGGGGARAFRDRCWVDTIMILVWVKEGLPIVRIVVCCEYIIGVLFYFGKPLPTQQRRPKWHRQAGFEVAANAAMVDLAAEMATAALDNVLMAEGPDSPRAQLLCQCVEACA